VDPDAILAQAKEGKPAYIEPTEKDIRAIREIRGTEALAPLATNPELRNLLKKIQKAAEQTIDIISKDQLIYAGPAQKTAQSHAQLATSFRDYIDTHKAEITALQILYSRPYKQRLTEPLLKELEVKLRENRPLFGTIVNGRMVLNEAGRVVGEEWRKSAEIRKEIELDEFVVMPNHVHGIVRILPKQGFDASNPSPKPQFGKPIAGALGTFVGAYKAAVSRNIGRGGGGGQLPTRTQMAGRIAAGASAIWHRNYWDVIVRDERALANIRAYIRFNPRNYEAVVNVGEPQFLGNRALMDMPKMGFLASRGEAVPHGRLPVRSNEAIVSGFLSPMERAVFKACLENQKPVIWMKPWGLEEKAASVNLAIEAGRLLLVSPFDDAIDVPSARRAAWCNQYVMEHCDRLVVGHLNPDGMLACILSEANPDMEITYL